MKVTRAGLQCVLFLLVIGLAGTVARSFRLAGSEQQVTFAQLTDAHLFDQGWNQQPLADAERKSPDNWDALHWSVDRINSLAKGGRRIDFVVYTGDLGLQNVAFPDSRTCPPKALHVKPGLPAVSEESGANQLVAELDRLTVRDIFFVSGTNDSLEEEASDGRFECFLLALQERTQWLDRPLRIQKLGPDHCFSVKGFHLLGLDSANFKNAGDLQKSCTPRARTGSLEQVSAGPCPQTQFGVLREQVETGGPTLVFTHVPDLKEPVGRQPAWDLDTKIRRDWERQAQSSNVLGIFAGCFRGSERGLYPNNAGAKSLALDPRVAAKTYLAPPLAALDGLARRVSGRGFLTVTANSRGISRTDVQWFDRRE